jgi:hypothetical protein
MLVCINYAPLGQPFGLGVIANLVHYSIIPLGSFSPSQLPAGLTKECQTINSFEPKQINLPRLVSIYNIFTSLIKFVKAVVMVTFLVYYRF